MGIKQKILRFLIENKEKDFSINEISKRLKIDYKLIHTNVKKLEKDRTIKIVDLGNMKRCTFSYLFNSEVFATEYQRREDFLKDRNFLVLHNRFEQVNGQFIMLLFGSYAKGTAKKHSDIDLLLISDEVIHKKIESEVNLIPLKIHLTAITYEDFVEMLKSKEQTVVTETIKNNLILFGIEDYYRILQNAR